MKIGIIGYGHVGGAMHDLFKEAVVYDKYKGIGSQEAINECDVAFICVPTPMSEDGSCDTSVVEEVIQWCNCKCLILRSTVRVGFTREMREKYKKEIVFQPEYYGETVAHPFANLSDRNWLTFGGTKIGINLAIQAYQTVINANIAIYQCTSDEAEMAKYMENAFFATKVTFCNEMYDLCKKLNIDYNVVREVWTADPRIGKYHTFVYENNRGYGGSCLPKDIASLRVQGVENGLDMTLVDAIIQKNKILRNRNKSNIIVVSGVPGVGKSSLSKAIASNLQIDKVSKDDEQIKLFEEFGFKSHDEKLQWVQKSEEILVEEIKKHLKEGKDLVVDKFYKNHESLIELKKLFDFNLIYIYLFASPEVVNDRYNKRGRDERPLCIDCINVYPYKDGVTMCWPEMNVPRVIEFLNMCKKPAVADYYFEIDVSFIDKDKVAEKALSLIKGVLI